jgi:hypothetical protein
MTANGKYLAKSNKGSTVYNPKARHVKSPGGTVRSLMSSGARVPTAIRPKMTRARRSNSGKARGVRAGVHAGNLARLFSPVAPKKRGRPAKVRSARPGPVARHHAAVLARKRRLAEKRAYSPMMGTKLAKMFKM